MNQFRNAECYLKHIEFEPQKYINLHEYFLINSKLLIIIKLFIIHFKMILSVNTKHILIIGDVRCLPKFIEILINNFDELVLVDDGISTIWFSEESYEFPYVGEIKVYTKYYDIIGQIVNTKQRLIRQVLPNVKLGESTQCRLIMLGGPYTEMGYLSETDWTKKLNVLSKHYDRFEGYYVPHPDENLSKDFGKFTVVEREKDIFSDLADLINENTIIVGCFSSALLDLKICFPNNDCIFFRLPDYEKRHDEHYFGFNVESRIYELFKKLKFHEIVI